MIQLIPAQARQQLGAIRALYLDAFPRVERKPFGMMVRKARTGDMELLCIEEDGCFLGLMITILHREIALLDYFAISPAHRGRGFGTEALDALRSRYPDRHLLLEIEDPDVPSDNTAERLRRQAFYQRNGLAAMPYRVLLFGVQMLVLTDGGYPVPFERYHAIFRAVFPKRVAAKNILHIPPPPPKKMT